MIVDSRQSSIGHRSRIASVSPRPVDLRPDPEALLRVRRRAAERGQLKMFLGYASGVGKSFRMFDEGRRRRERGEDVVVAARAARHATPTCGDRRAARDDPAVGCMDGVRVDRRGRRPGAPAGGLRGRRAGLRQPAGQPPPQALPGRRGAARRRHLGADGGQPRVHRRSSRTSSSGSRAAGKRQTVPQDFIDRADEVVVVDAPPEAEPRSSEHARRSFASARCCSTADVVDRQLEAYLRLNASSRHGARRSGSWSA